MEEHNDYKNLMIDTAEGSYSERYLKKYRLLYPLLGRMGKPKDFSRFIIQAKSCIYHNAYPELDKNLHQVRSRHLRRSKRLQRTNLKVFIQVRYPLIY